MASCVVIYTQVSIFGQALILVTCTACINTWFIAEEPCNFLVFALAFAKVATSDIVYFGFQGYPSDRIAVFACGGSYLGIAWLLVRHMTFCTGLAQICCHIPCRIKMSTQQTPHVPPESTREIQP
ncbi:hypothetical protein AC1031_010806 [Aphanomyces cochlioides]|nr:hypothetical protein AC1031_010806 [Aphanomyces cochlioides]